MAAETCPYCLQVTNQGQNLYGPICNNGHREHRAHLNCIMNQFESNGRFNIDTWTCPICRAPAYYSPDSGIPSLNQVLRDRFPRRISNLEGEEYSSEEDTDMEEEPDDSQNEELTIEDRLIQQYPFLDEQYRENEGGYRVSIMNQLTQDVRMLGVFPESAQFQSPVDAAHMADILLTQWYNMYNMARFYEGEGDMEEVHSSLSNQSPFFRALTMAILSGFMSQFWNLDQEHLDALNEVRRRAAQADGVLTGGKRKKKTRRKRRRGKNNRTKRRRAGTKRKRDGPPTPRRPPRRRLNQPPQQQQQQGQLDIDNDDYDDYEALMEDIAANVDPDDPNFIQGGRRKKRGGMEEPSTPPRPPKDNDRGTNRYPPGFRLPPPQVPVRPTAQPPQVRMRRRINRQEFRDIHPGARAPTQRMINEYNEQLRRSQNSRVRNVAGDVLEACTGSRCGLGGRRKKKRKKKTRRKRGSHHEALLLGAVAVSKLINKKRKNKKRRTKKKSRRRRKRR